MPIEGTKAPPKRCRTDIDASISSIGEVDLDAATALRDLERAEATGGTVLATAVHLWYAENSANGDDEDDVEELSCAVCRVLWAQWSFLSQ